MSELETILSDLKSLADRLSTALEGLTAVADQGLTAQEAAEIFNEHNRA